jgi:hypothetical protein
VVGLGYIAQIAVLPAFRHAHENSELVALVSGDQEKRKKLATKYKLNKTYGYERYAGLPIRSQDAAAVQYILRFLIGGAVVCLFAPWAKLENQRVLQSCFPQPPLSLLPVWDWRLLSTAKYSHKSRSMLIGAAAFFIYSLVCCRLMIRQRFRATPVAIIALVPWLVVALGGWTLLLRSWR